MATLASRRAISTSAARLAVGERDVDPPASGVSTGSSPATSPRRPRAPGVGAGEPAAAWRVELPTLALELVGRALGDLAAPVDHRDPVGELVGLVEVLRGQQHGAAVARPGRGWCPTSGRGCAGRDRWWARRGRSAAGGRSGTRRGRAGAACHRRTGRCACPRRPPGRTGRAGRSAVGALLSIEAGQPAEQPQVLGGRQVLVDRGVLPGDADELADLVRDAATSTPKIRACPPSIGSSVASMRSMVVLPAPLGPSTPKTSPGRTSRSMPSTAAEVAEALDEARGVYSGCRRHSSFWRTHHDQHVTGVAADRGHAGITSRGWSALATEVVGADTDLVPSGKMMVSGSPSPLSERWASMSPAPPPSGPAASDRYRCARAAVPVVLIDIPPAPWRSLSSPGGRRAGPEPGRSASRYQVDLELLGGRYRYGLFGDAEEHRWSVSRGRAVPTGRCRLGSTACTAAAWATAVDAGRRTDAVVVAVAGGESSGQGSPPDEGVGGRPAAPPAVYDLGTPGSPRCSEEVLRQPLSEAGQAGRRP